MNLESLAAMRLGLIRRLLDTATERLSWPSGGDEPLVCEPMIAGPIADIVADIELLRGYANFLLTEDAPAPLAGVAGLHARITGLDLEVIGLLRTGQPVAAGQMLYGGGSDQ
jgi:hypothetical protein